MFLSVLFAAYCTFAFGNLAEARKPVPVDSASTNQIELPYQAQKGARFTVTAKQSKTKAQVGKPPVTTNRSMTYDAEVTDTTDDEYIVKWTLKSVDVENPGDASPSTKLNVLMEREILAPFIGQSYELISDAGGRPQEVPDWNSLSKIIVERVSASLPAALNKFQPGLAENPQIKPIIAGTVASMKQVYEDRDSKSTSEFFEAEMLAASVQHLALPLGKKLVWRSEQLPIFANQNAVSFRTTIELLKHDPQQDETTIEWITTYDRKQLSDAAVATMKQLLSRYNLPESQTKPLFERLEKGLDIKRVDTGRARLRISDALGIRDQLCPVYRKHHQGV